jgi:hypothetical protein
LPPFSVSFFQSRSISACVSTCTMSVIEVVMVGLRYLGRACPGVTQGRSRGAALDMPPVRFFGLRANMARPSGDTGVSSKVMRILARILGGSLMTVGATFVAMALIDIVGETSEP